MSNLYSVERFQGSLNRENKFVGYITDTGVVFNASLSSDGVMGPPGPKGDTGPRGPEGPEAEIDTITVEEIVELFQ